MHSSHTVYTAKPLALKKEKWYNYSCAVIKSLQFKKRTKIVEEQTWSRD
jgi:hypothetical protein